MECGRWELTCNIEAQKQQDASHQLFGKILRFVNVPIVIPLLIGIVCVQKSIGRVSGGDFFSRLCFVHKMKTDEKFIEFYRYLYSVVFVMVGHALRKRLKQLILCP